MGNCSCRVDKCKAIRQRDNWKCRYNKLKNSTQDLLNILNNEGYESAEALQEFYDRFEDVETIIKEGE